MKPLLPYAYDNNGNIQHIDNAIKGNQYTCPCCGAKLLLKISKIPEGEKHHRRNHFAHKGHSDTHCSESFLHKLFKEKCADFLREKISKQENLFFKWKCQRCSKQHSNDLLKDIATIILEYDLGVCRPDIALFDNNNRLLSVIEVIVTHKPKPEVLKYYEDHKIVCLQVRVNDFSCCNDINNTLSHLYTDSMFLCNTPIGPIEPIGTDTRSPHAFLVHFLQEKGNKFCKKCGSELHIDKEEGIWERPILKCQNSNCDYIETLSDYEHIIFPNMK